MFKLQSWWTDVTASMVEAGLRAAHQEAWLVLCPTTARGGIPALFLAHDGNKLHIALALVLDIHMLPTRRH